MAPHCQQRAGQRWARQPGDRVERGQGRGDGQAGLPPRRGHQHQVAATVILTCSPDIEYWMGNWTVSDVTGHAGVTGRYLANAIISDKSK